PSGRSDGGTGVGAMSFDHVALLPACLAAATAVAAFLADLIAPGRGSAVAGVTAVGALATGVVAILVGRGPVRRTFCSADCSYVADHRAALVAALFAALTLAVVALSVPVPRLGEYYFLLGCAMTGGVVLGYAGDLITLIVALETLTLPLYILVALKRGTVDAAVTFFIVSVVSTAVALLGAALLYAGTGAVHFGRLVAALETGHRLPLTTAGVVLLLAGLSFKVAAVPFHAWAPPAYDGAPLPVAAFLSTASKLGGVIAILYVALDALRPAYDLVAPTIAVLAVLSMTVGNLVALRQDRMVRPLLATGTGWLAVVVALNAVLGLAYYLRAAATLFAPTPAAARTRVPWPVAAALVGATVAAVVVGFAPQLVLAATQP